MSSGLASIESSIAPVTHSRMRKYIDTTNTTAPMIMRGRTGIELSFLDISPPGPVGGEGRGGSCGGRAAAGHHVDELVEQRRHVVRAGARLGMALERERRRVGQ